MRVPPERADALLVRRAVRPRERERRAVVDVQPAVDGSNGQRRPLYRA